MSLDKKLNVLLVLTVSFFAIVLGEIVLGSIIPEPILAGIPWSIWTVIGTALIYMAATFLFFFISGKRDRND